MMGLRLPTNHHLDRCSRAPGQRALVGCVEPHTISRQIKLGDNIEHLTIKADEPRTNTTITTLEARTRNLSRVGCEVF
jgi:hypothetical protein